MEDWTGFDLRKFPSPYGRIRNREGLWRQRPKGTYHKGISSGEELGDILLRLTKGESLVSIARQYGCSYQAIQQIRNRYART